MRTKSTLPLMLVLAVVTAASLAAAPAGAANSALKDLMKKMGAQVASGEAKALASAFTQTKTMGKSEFPNWNAISDKGKAAAESGDVGAAKATCRECHDAYRTEYRAKYGSKAP